MVVDGSESTNDWITKKKKEKQPFEEIADQREVGQFFS